MKRQIVLIASLAVGIAAAVLTRVYITAKEAEFRKDRDALRHAVRDRKAMWCAFGATLFGPFVGTSMSLLATMYTSTGIAQTLFALTPILIIAPAAWLFHQRVTPREIIGATISVAGVSLFFI